MVIVDVFGLYKYFKDGDKIVEAVNNLNLQVEEGCIFGFLGPNGAGKTTSLRIMTTLLDASKGTVRIVGYDLMREPAKIRQNIGYVAQLSGCVGSATGRENLILQGRLHDLSKSESITRANELINIFKLEAISDRKTETYSGGQRRRIDIAIGLMNKPKLLFLDEPTIGLDPQSRELLWGEIKKMRDLGVTIFLTTHYMEEADALCNSVAIIDAGSIVASGSPADLKKQIANEILNIGINGAPDCLEKGRTLLAAKNFILDITIDEGNKILRATVESGDYALPIVAETLITAGLSVKSLEVTRPSLNEVFLKKTGKFLRE